MSECGTEADARRERRRWIRQHHPDVGGDPSVFDAGLRGLSPLGKAGEPVTAADVRPSVVRTRSVRRAARRLARRLRALRRRTRHHGRVR